VFDEGFWYLTMRINKINLVGTGTCSGNCNEEGEKREEAEENHPHSCRRDLGGSFPGGLGKRYGGLCTLFNLYANPHCIYEAMNFKK
jgi:hypothetical protein